MVFNVRQVSTRGFNARPGLMSRAVNTMSRMVGAMSGARALRPLAAASMMSAAALSGCALDETGTAPSPFDNPHQIDPGPLEFPASSCLFDINGNDIRVEDGVYLLSCPVELKIEDYPANALAGKTITFNIAMDSSQNIFKIPLIAQDVPLPNGTNGNVDLTGKDIDIDGDGTPEIIGSNPDLVDAEGNFLYHMPKEDAPRYFGGMINASALSTAVLNFIHEGMPEVAAGKFCAEPVTVNGQEQAAYDPMIICPSCWTPESPAANSDCRLPVHRLGYNLWKKDANNEWTTVDGQVYVNMVEYLQDPDTTGKPLETADAPLSITISDLTPFISGEKFNFKFTFDIGMNGRNIDGNTPYQNVIALQPVVNQPGVE